MERWSWALGIGEDPAIPSSSLPLLNAHATEFSREVLPHPLKWRLPAATPYSMPLMTAYGQCTEGVCPTKWPLWATWIQNQSRTQCQPQAKLVRTVRRCPSMEVPVQP